MGLRRRWVEDAADEGAADVGLEPSASPSGEEALIADEQSASEPRTGGDKVVDQVKRYLARSDEPEGSAQNVELAQVGVHVASVLSAAESAAERLRTEAEQAAERTRREAAEAADELRARVATEVEAQRAEARRQSSLVEEETRRARAEADRYAEERRRAADDEATRILQAAEARAASLAGEAEERNRELMAEIAASEKRTRRLAASLRGVADRLDGVADGSKPAAEAAVDAESDDYDVEAFEEHDDQVLDEELAARVGEEAR